MNKGLNLWKKAVKIIPGGNGLLSKRPNRYVPQLWPTYYKKAKGVYIWDLNNSKYMDMAQMGMGAVNLGYSNDYVNKQIKKGIKNGVASTLNSREEYILAKKILKFNKFADQVKFARGGGEAMSMAVRIARAANSKNEIIAFSGYHGWHDWYLATNIRNKNNLKDHLLPGLDPLGVPKSLKGTVIGFEYNNIKQFQKIDKKKLAAVVIEGCRYSFPKKEFLKEIVSTCKKNNICLIIDEITSGWRFNIGGIYKRFNLKPDIVVFGKGLGNGYAISCIVGKKKYMKYSNKSFMSSTAWTERIGFVAGISTIDYFIKKKVHSHIDKIGKIIKKNWLKIAKKHNLKLKVSETNAICAFFLYYQNKEELYTLFSKIMLRNNILATNSIYISYAHKLQHVKNYLKICDLAFFEIKEFISKKKKLNKNNIRSMGLNV